MSQTTTKTEGNNKTATIERSKALDPSFAYVIKPDDIIAQLRSIPGVVYQPATQYGYQAQVYSNMDLLEFVRINMFNGNSALNPETINTIWETALVMAHLRNPYNVQQQVVKNAIGEEKFNEIYNTAVQSLMYQQPMGMPGMQQPMGMGMGMPGMQQPMGMGMGMPGMQQPMGMPGMQQPMGMPGMQQPMGMGMGMGMPGMQQPMGMPGMQQPQQKVDDSAVKAAKSFWGEK